jgi:hypothetical protein
MGFWNITIRGTGCHHNGRPDIDADLAAAELVKTLKAQGATITAASFTTGSDYDLSNPDEYIAAYGPGGACAPKQNEPAPVPAPAPTVPEPVASVTPPADPTP